MFTTKARRFGRNILSFVLFVSFVVSNDYSSTTEISDFTPFRFNSSKNIG